MAKSKKDTETKKINDHTPELYNPEYLYNQSLELLQDYSADPLNNVKKLHDISNIQFLDALHYVGRGLFAGLDVDNDPLLKALLIDVYININNKFNKIVSIEGFGYFTGIQPEQIKLYAADAGHVKKDVNIMQYICILYRIYANNNIISKSDYNNIYNIYNNNSMFLNDNIFIDGHTIPPDVITAVNGIIYNKLHDMREAGLKARLLSDKQQLGAVAVANREFGWSADRIADEERARALTLSDLPKLSSYVNPLQIAETSEAP